MIRKWFSFDVKKPKKDTIVWLYYGSVITKDKRYICEAWFDGYEFTYVDNSTVHNPIAWSRHSKIKPDVPRDLT